MIMILLVTLSDLHTTRGNPIPVDSGSGTTPIPLEVNSGVNLKEETIMVTFDEKNAHINAKYIFRNSISKITDLKIMFPFITMPTNITLVIEGIEETYELVEEFEHENLVRSFRYGIICEIQCSDNEEIECKLSYSREYLIYRSYRRDNKYTRYQYRYPVWTTKYWNDSIDTALFVFRIPEKLIDEGPFSRNNNTNITKENGFILVVIEYTNLTSNAGSIYIAWYQKTTLSETGNNEIFLSLLIYSSILILIAVIFFVVSAIAFLDNKKNIN
jgi:hypothetical protein